MVHEVYLHTLYKKNVMPMVVPLLLGMHVTHTAYGSKGKKRSASHTSFFSRPGEEDGGDICAAIPVGVRFIEHGIHCTYIHIFCFSMIQSYI